MLFSSKCNNNKLAPPEIILLIRSSIQQFTLPYVKPCPITNTTKAKAHCVIHVGNKMNLFGIEIAETVEIFGVTFLVNPVTMLIAAFPLVLALAAFYYWLSQRNAATPGYKHDYDFYDVYPHPTIQNNAMLNNNAMYDDRTMPNNRAMVSNNAFSNSAVQNNYATVQAPAAPISMMDIEDDITEAVQVPAFYTSAPAYLVYISGGEHLPKKLPIDGNSPIQIGRKKSYCEVVIDDKRVSRLHAIITPSDNGFSIVDEGSAGGTFVNRKLLRGIDNHQLAHNDIINFNEVEYRFEITTEKWQGAGAVTYPS